MLQCFSRMQKAPEKSDTQWLFWVFNKTLGLALNVLVH